MPLLPPAASPHLRVGRPGFHHIVPQLAPDGLCREAWGKKIINRALSPVLPVRVPCPGARRGAGQTRGSAGGAQTQTPAAKGRCFAARERPPPPKGRELKNGRFCQSSQGAKLQQGPHRCVNPAWVWDRAQGFGRRAGVQAPVAGTVLRGRPPAL